MTLEPGKQILHYAISGKLGEGGMGVVWRGTDISLNRPVAVKVLPPELTADADRLARFQREARVLASLSHPGIASVYGLHEDGGIHFLAMELVEGEDLAKRLARGRIPVDEALELARQIAEALEAAHESGIVHRDLKPANILVTPEGRVKILDFGLAKIGEPGASSSDPSLSPTLTAAATRAGTIMGTASYMSPEQARGKAVDRRADLWAFGCVLYEMLAGRRAFAGETVTDILAQLVHAEPELEALPSETPSRIRVLIRRCLRKEPARRLRSAGDAALEIEEALSGEAGPEPAPTAQSGARRAGWITALPWVLLLLLAGWMTVSGMRQEAPRAARVEFQIDAPEGRGLGEFTVSPDGRRIAMVATTQQGERRLWIRSLDSGEPRSLPGTDGVTYPFWSPDGGSVGFFARGELHRIDLDTGTGVALAPAPNGRGGAWGGDGTIIFAPEGESGLWSVSASGGTPAELTSPEGDEVTHRFPHFLHDGRRFTYLAQAIGGSDSKAWVDSLDGGDRRPLDVEVSAEIYAPPGYLLTVSRRTLVARPFDAGALRPADETMPLARGVLSAYPRNGRASFSVSNSGVLAYRTVKPVEVELIWFDREGRRREAVTPPGQYLLPELSPDGGRVAFGREDPPPSESSSLLVYDLNRGSTRRFIQGLAAAEQVSSLVWTPGGDGLIYIKSRAILRKRLGRADEAEVLLEAATGEDPSRPKWPLDLHLAGRGTVLYMANWDSSTDIDIWALPLDPAGELQPLIRKAGSQRSPRLSPDGRWLAYVSDETGNTEIYVLGLEPGAGTWMISSGGGNMPRWSPDGEELFYLAPDRILMAVPVEEGPGTVFGAPEPLFEAPPGLADVSTDLSVVPQLVAVRGNRFLFIVSPRSFTSAQSMTVVLNWSRGL